MNARGSMRGHANPRVASCLSQLTCPWGELRPCHLLPPYAQRESNPQSPGPVRPACWI